jgi:hypothetical protein
LSILAGISAANGQTLSSGADVGIGQTPNLPVLPPGATGRNLAYGADVGLGETDNVNLSSTDKISQTIATADMDFLVQQQTRLLDLDLKGDFTDFDYLQHAYGNEFVGRFDGAAKLALVPDRLTWVLQDDFGQAQLDPYTPVTPGNLENINYVSTGPDLSLHLGATGFVNATARVANAEYGTSPFDSNRVLGSLAWGLHLSPSSSVSLNVDSERVLFDNTVVNTDFDHSSAFVRYEAQGARTTLTANLGATEINQEGATTSAPLVELGLTRTLSPAAKVALSAGRELTDPAASFSAIQGGAISPITTAPAILTSGSYTENYVSGVWSYVHNRTTVTLNARWEKDTYGVQSGFDNTRAGGDFSVARQLTQAWSAQLLGRWYKMDYPNGIVALEDIGVTEVNGGVTEVNGVVISANGVAGTAAGAATDYATGTIGAALVWRHGRWLVITLRCEHSTEVVTGVGSGYSENRAFLTVGYRPRTAASAPSP